MGDRHQIVQFPPHRNPVDPQVLAIAVVREDQDAHRVRAVDVWQEHARRCADPPLEIEALHPGAGSHTAFRDGAVHGGVQRRRHVLVVQRERQDVAQERVVTLGDHRHDLLGCLAPCPPGHPPERGVVGLPDLRDDVSTTGLISTPHSRSWFTPISSP